MPCTPPVRLPSDREYLQSPLSLLISIIETPFLLLYQWARSKNILAFLLVIYSGKMAGLIYLASTHITSASTFEHGMAAQLIVARLTTLAAHTALPRPQELAIGPCIPSDTSATMMAYCVSSASPFTSAALYSSIDQPLMPENMAVDSPGVRYDTVRTFPV